MNAAIISLQEPTVDVEVSGLCNLWLVLRIQLCDSRFQILPSRAMSVELVSLRVVKFIFDASNVERFDRFAEHVQLSRALCTCRFDRSARDT